MAKAKWERTEYPGIYKRGSRFVAVYRDHEGKQRNKAFSTKDKARKFKSRTEAAVESGEYNPDSQRAFVAYARE